MWEAATGHDLFSLKGHFGGAFSVSFSPDGKRLVSCSWDGTVKVWESATGQDQPSSELVFQRKLNDGPVRLRWHCAEAADSEATQQWFAAAFHLRQLLADKEADADKLQERLRECENRLR